MPGRVFVGMLLAAVLAVVVVALPLLLLVDAVSMLLLSLDVVDVCGMTILLLWFGWPPKESYMYLPKLPTMSLHMYPFDCL